MNSMGLDLSLWTIGHSTRPINEFLELLCEFEIKLLVDVRSFPGRVAIRISIVKTCLHR